MVIITVDTAFKKQYCHFVIGRSELGNFTEFLPVPVVEKTHKGCYADSGSAPSF